MTRRRHTLPSAIRTAASIAVVLTAVVIASPASAQNPDWRVVENPYQEDIEYTIGATHTPRVEVENVRWHSFTIESPDPDLLRERETVDISVALEFENRGTKSAKILLILLLEDADGNPLDRIEAKQFKLASGRLKERNETANLPSEVIRSTRRVYAFFEILH